MILVYLTTSPASDHSPAWAPDGRHIAFISTQNGNSEVILADLDRTDNSRFQNLSNTELASESHPVWSPDGRRLAWASSSQSVGRSGIYVWDSSKTSRGHGSAMETGPRGTSRAIKSSAC